MSGTALRIETDTRGVTRVTLNRPDIRNAFDEGLIAELTKCFTELGEDETVRVVVLTGEGSAFSAGADLNWMRRMADNDQSENAADARKLARLMHTLNDLPKPTLALVNGPAFGGGVGLIAACDIALASDDAFFALSEVRLGLIPSAISPFVVEAIGARNARRYFLSGERFPADEALRLGLLHEVTRPDKLEAASSVVISELLKCGPHSQTAAKDLIRYVGSGNKQEAVIEETARRIARIRASAEGREGLSAFLEKRNPEWMGSS